MKKKWTVKSSNKELQTSFVKELNILPITAKLLINRGLVDIGEAFSFLSPNINEIHDPFLMKDMDKAVERVLSAIANGEKIAVFGDYDVDGTTATALLKLFFTELGVEVESYIPERLTEGYGLSTSPVDTLAGKGVTLIITTDCGVSNFDEITYASTVGVDVIITDHHVVPDNAPPAFAIINPRQKGCEFPFKGLAGVGVAFNFAMGIRKGLREAGHFASEKDVPNLKRYLDLVCIGTVADMVPLVEENRLLVKYGIEVLKNTDRPGLKALKSVAGVRGDSLDAETISFQLAPRINAAGRVSRADIALELLTTVDPGRARELARELDSINCSRQEMEREIYSEAEALLKKEEGKKGFVLSSENWHPGVIGIAASKLVNQYNRPTVMIALDGDIGRGSARGIKNFDLLEGIKSCAHLLERYGGHKAAAGFTIKKENIEAFKSAFLAFVETSLTDDDLIAEVELDAVVNLDEVDARFIREIEKLSPFGISNREPLFCAEDTHIVNTQIVGQKHLRLKVKHKGAPIKAIAFGMSGLHPMKGAGFDLVFRPYMDDWQGRRSLALRIKDVTGTLVCLYTLTARLNKPWKRILKLRDPQPMTSSRRVELPLSQTT